MSNAKQVILQNNRALLGEATKRAHQVSEEAINVAITPKQGLSHNAERKRLISTQH
jgi:hypothetical protein